MSTTSSTRQFSDGITITTWVPQPKPVEQATDAQIGEKPRKKKNRGGKKAKVSKIELAVTNDTKSQAVDSTTVQAGNVNNTVPASPPLSQTAKNKLKAQAKADKTARAAQIAAAAKAKKMGVSLSTDDTTPAVEVSEESSVVGTSKVPEDVSAEVTATSSSDAGDVVDAPKSSSNPVGASSFDDVGTPFWADASSVSVDASSTAATCSPPPDAADPADTPDSSSVVEDAASPTGIVKEPLKSTSFHLSEDTAFGFGHNATFNFGHASSLDAGNVAFPGILPSFNLSDALAKFGRAFAPKSSSPGNVLSLETSNAATSWADSGASVGPLPSKFRKATSFVNAIRKHQEKQGKPSVLDSSKAPRDMVSVKLNRKPLTESSKKDHQEPNPFVQTLAKKSSTDLICAEAIQNLQAKFGVTVPRKAVKKPSKPFVIEYYPSVDGESSDKLVEMDDNHDEEMPDAVSIAGAEDCAEEAVAPRITDAEDASVVIDAAEPVIKTAESENVLADQANEVMSKDVEFTQIKDAQQYKATTQETTEIEEQAFQGDVDEVIIDEQITSPPSSAHSEMPSPAEEIVIETPPVNDTPSSWAAESVLDFLAFPNVTEYLPVLSRDTEQALVDAHVTLYLHELPGAVKKLTRAEKKAAKHARATQINDTLPAVTSKSELNFLSFPHVAEYLPTLSNGTEKALVDIHIVPLNLQQVPGAVEKPTVAGKKASKKASKKTAKAKKKALAKQAILSTSDAPVELSTEPAEVPQELSTEAAEPPVEEVKSADEGITPAAEELVAPVPINEDTFVSTLLAMPNGPGHTAAARLLEETLVALYTCDLTLPTPPSSASSAGDARSSDHGVQPGEQTGKAAQSVDAAQTQHTSRSTSTSALKEFSAIKMRNTFLGITSLDELVEVLSISPSKTVAKDDLCTAFSICAAAESEALLGYIPAHINKNFASTITLGRTKLGKTSLLGFLQAVKWVDDVASLNEIMCAFQKKSAESDEFSDKVLAASELYGEV